ncbi:hypothetical protein BJV78DRAFT_1157800 [Lactifluus subvellereus]|nr:hypothetical protein BJV78DRAFT_1157800 [Lactifluus subvellereus]
MCHSPSSEAKSVDPCAAWRLGDEDFTLGPRTTASRPSSALVAVNRARVVSLIHSTQTHKLKNKIECAYKPTQEGGSAAVTMSKRGVSRRQEQVERLALRGSSHPNRPMCCAGPPQANTIITPSVYALQLVADTTAVQEELSTVNILSGREPMSSVVPRLAGRDQPCYRDCQVSAAAVPLGKL